VSAATVSVLLIVRDGERYIAEAIHSALSQSLAPLEVVVIDDGSEDRSATIAAAFGPPVRVFSQPPRGIGAARNAAVEAARGEFLAFLDADDRLPFRSLERRLAALEGPPAADLAWGMVRHFRSPELPGEVALRLHCPEDIYPAHLPGGLLARRAAVRRVGAFDCDLELGEFVDWGTRAHELGLREATVADVVLERRVHAAHQTLRHRGELTDLTRILRSSLHRRSSSGQV
jgi:glycosyltransferase involved in cell wall biosynthesis